MADSVRVRATVTDDEWSTLRDRVKDALLRAGYAERPYDLATGIVTEVLDTPIEP
jgi:hypothetical protein